MLLGVVVVVSVGVIVVSVLNGVDVVGVTSVGVVLLCIM